MTDPGDSCPHCGTRLSTWKVPEDATWTEEFFRVCFNDHCPYYTNGWIWMEEQYGQTASFRYGLNPSTGACLPIPVWSDTATREMIVDEEEGSEQ